LRLGPARVASSWRSPGESAGFMHLFSTLPAKPSSSGESSGQSDPGSEPN
jgi:hypothetical protein